MIEQQRTAIDWELLHRRIAAAREALEKGWVVGDEARRRILGERAAELARELQPARDRQSYLEVLAFELGGEIYAVEPRYVREVQPLKNLTFVPCAPAFVLGIINVRGQILSVIDLRKFFDLQAGGLSDLNKVIILSRGEMEVGVLADAVNGVREIALDEVEPGLPTLTGIRESYLKGISRGGLVILDAGKMLADEKLIVNEQA